jgi:hypothetical protein
MTCSERERDLALYAGGDLRDSELDQHVAQCATCREFVESLRGLLADVSADQPPVTPPIASAVVARLRRRRYGWAALAATAAAASVLIAAMISMLARPLPTISVTLNAPAVAVVPVPRAAEREVQPVRRTVRPRKPAPPAEPVVVQLVTDDPNVVIYWITD